MKFIIRHDFSILIGSKPVKFKAGEIDVKDNATIDAFKRCQEAEPVKAKSKEAKE